MTVTLALVLALLAPPAAQADAQAMQVLRLRTSEKGTGQGTGAGSGEGAEGPALGRGEKPADARQGPREAARPVAREVAGGRPAAARGGGTQVQRRGARVRDAHRRSERHRRFGRGPETVVSEAGRQGRERPHSSCREPRPGQRRRRGAGPRLDRRGRHAVPEDHAAAVAARGQTGRTVVQAGCKYVGNPGGDDSREDVRRPGAGPGSSACGSSSPAAAAGRVWPTAPASCCRRWRWAISTRSSGTRIRSRRDNDRPCMPRRCPRRRAWWTNRGPGEMLVWIKQ